MRNVRATTQALVKFGRSGWREQRGSQGLQAAAIAVAAAVVVTALITSVDAQVQPAVQRAMDCANAELSGLAGCPSGDAAIQQAFEQANGALGLAGGAVSGTGTGSTGAAAGAAAGSDPAGDAVDPAAPGGAAAATSWWDRIGQWFGQQWQDAKEGGAQVWDWLQQTAVQVGIVIGAIAAAIAAAVAAVVSAPVWIVAGIVFGIVAIISGTVFANDRHGQPWYTNLVKHLGIGVAAVAVGVLTWALELSVAAIAGITAAVTLVAVGVTALLNKLSGERRWDIGLLLNIGLALVTLGVGVGLRGARAADPPPVVQGVDDVADAAPDARPALPCGGGRGPGLAAPLSGSCVELMQQRAAELRQAFSIGKGRNIAIANVDLPQMADEVVGVSGEALRTGTVPSPSHRFFSTTIDQFPRDFDAEVKVLEYIAHRHADAPGVYPNVRGTITLFTERPPCQSCSGVIEQFQHMFPNVKVDVLFNP